MFSPQEFFNSYGLSLYLREMAKKQQLSILSERLQIKIQFYVIKKHNLAPHTSSFLQLRHLRLQPRRNQAVTLNVSRSLLCSLALILGA